MINDNFLENTPQEMSDFIDYCAKRGWVKSRRWALYARKMKLVVQRAIQRGWIKPAKDFVPTPVGEPLLICGGKHERHRWSYVEGFGDHCERCNAKPSRKYNRKTQSAETFHVEQPAL